MVLNLTIDATGHVSHAEVATSAGPGRRGVRRGRRRRRQRLPVRARRERRQARPRGAGLQGEVPAARHKAPRRPRSPRRPRAGAHAVAARRLRRRPAREPGGAAPRARDAQPAHRRGGHRDAGRFVRRFAAAGVRGDQRRQRPLRVLRSRAGHLARRRRGARLLPLPHQRGGPRRGEDRRDLLRRARPGEPAGRDGDRRAPEEGRHPRRADRRRDRQGAGHGGRSAGGASRTWRAWPARPPAAAS